MPTYQVTTTTALAADTRSRIALAVTAAHERATGADAVLAQVLFDVLAPGNAYVGGRPAGDDHVFVRATIRGGRPASVTDHLVGLLVEAVATAADVPRAAVWIYVHELPPRLMVEYGRPLPLPGEEAEWLAGLDEPGSGR